MTADDLRRLALSLPGVVESSHMGHPDFRVGGHIFATLASQSLGYGNLKLTPELQSEFIEARPDLFLPIHGGWGRMGMTHIRLSIATQDELAGALRAAWNLRHKANTTPASKTGSKATSRLGTKSSTTPKSRTSRRKTLP